MLYIRMRRLVIIAVLVIGTLFVFMALPALAAEQVLAVRSAVGNHYETPLRLDLSAGQVININAYCTDASGTGITYVHYFEVGADATAEHPEYNESIYYQRWDCQTGVNASFTARVGTQYHFTFHVHTNEYGCDGTESCATLTGISHFNYYLKVTTDTVTPPTTAEPTAVPTSEVTPDPTATAEPTSEPTAAPTSEVTPDPIATAEPTSEPTAAPTDPVTTSEPTSEGTPDPTATAEPTSEPTAESTSEPTVVPPRRPIPTPAPGKPELARDARLNFKSGDLTAVVYRNRDNKGAPALVVYGVNSGSRGYLLCTVTNFDLGVFAKQAPDQNTLIKNCSDTVSVYVLTTGEVQINITEQNKVFVTVFDSLEAKTIKHLLLEA